MNIDRLKAKEEHSLVTGEPTPIINKENIIN
jgi:hypothetical protein